MRYENTSAGHYAYYDINMIETHIEGEWVVMVEWGVIGTKSPKKRIMKKGNFEECRRAYNYRIKKRLKHGYKAVVEDDKSKDRSRIF